MAQYGPNLPAALCSLLTGADFRGTLPIDIPAMDAAGRFTDEILYPRGSGIVPDSQG